MPLKLIRDNLLHVCKDVDAIVNPTDSFYSGGGGVDYLVHRAAGPELNDFCVFLSPLERGKANATPGFRCGCKHIFHTCGPVWKGGGFNEEEDLISCYKSCLRLAKNNECRSVAFPLISSGTFGYPKDAVLRVAMNAIMEFLATEYNDLMVYLVIYDKTAYSLSKQLVTGIEERISDEYAELHGAIWDYLAEGTIDEAYEAWRERRGEAIRIWEVLCKRERTDPKSRFSYRDALFDISPAEEYGDGNACADNAEETDEESARMRPAEEYGDGNACADNAEETDEESARMRLPCYGAVYQEDEAELPDGAIPAVRADAAPAPRKTRKPTKSDEEELSQLLKHQDEGLRDVLLRFIDERQIKDSEAYNRSNISKSVFGKIKNKPEYHPGKQIVLAFAAGLQLTMDETLELLAKAGHSFTHEPFDVIVRYCLEKGIYDISEINMLLFRYDQKLLGSN